jgi:hypothetical protein
MLLMIVLKIKIMVFLFYSSALVDALFLLCSYLLKPPAKQLVAAGFGTGSSG